MPFYFKTTSYLGAVFARRDIGRRGFLEGIQLGVGGEVVSGTVSNVFVVRDDLLLTPWTASGCRPGVTREVVLEIAARLGLRTQERALGLEDVENGDEVFFTNTMMECLPVATIDGRAVRRAAGPTTRRISEALKEAVRG
jgi:branched-subunit amino acid aminotransferase/4-amino-4-deoxychorismate lyase